MSDLPMDSASEPSIASSVSVDLPIPARALAIGAHPDDVEFQCGATFAKWAAAGCEINHLVCTDGSKGTWDPDQDPSELVATRQHEQREAARALGSTGEVAFLGWTDGELESGLRQRWQVAYWIRRLKPDVVLGHDPWKRYRLHPDHRHAGLLAVEGIVAARDPLFFPEQGEKPHRPDVLLLFEADEPDHVENVDGHVDTKITALLRHESQFETTMAIGDSSSGDEIDPDGSQRRAFEDRINDRLAAMGALGGVARGEAFKAMRKL